MKEFIEKYEKATEWMNNATTEEVEKHYDRYLEVIEEVRVAFDIHIKEELGYNPYKNYEDLLKED